MAKGTAEEVKAPEQLGAIALNVDIGTGVAEVLLTAPYGLQTLKAKVPLIDILESVAEINLTLYKAQRAMMLKMRNDFGKGS
jgi:hypothetical protein